ncbi:MAG: isoprenylcysteine carboxylmethyltransferase family protein [Chloroflexi bacterium]|nr:isoprenylcysteine carboxylmethyltransferase family protein [Chloroflexota bacterium]
MIARLEAIANLIILAGAFALGVVIVISWLGSIRSPKAAPISASRWFALPAWAQVIVGFAAIALFIYIGFLLWIRLPIRLPPEVSASLRIIGLAIYLAGLSLVFWARWALGTMYGVSTTFAAPLQAGHQLIQHGPYAFVRHPMYLGYWLMLAAVTLVYRMWAPLILLVMTLASFHRRAQREEFALAQQFGEVWKAYADNAPMFHPRWKKKSREDS